MIAQDPTQLPAWKALQTHFLSTKEVSMRTQFAENPNRAAEMHLRWHDFLVDFSKNRLSNETLGLLRNLAQEMQLAPAIEAYFTGEIINKTENRSVLHTALRADKKADIRVNGINVLPEIEAVKAQMQTFSEAVISGTHKGFTGKAITDVVNIGIGGSDLGPDMVVEALQFYKNHLNTHFISNVDGDHVREVIQHLNPETTLFVIVSKTFTTQETLSNAETARKWFLKSAPATAVSQHFVAVSTNLEKVTAFGIDPNNVFTMWDWVGGRFSLWSAVGLTVALAVGFDHFESLLSGAQQMDEHFRHTDWEHNIPVTMALITIWYNNFHGAESEAIIPYSQYLRKFAPYLQQGIMESNGKSVGRNGERVSHQTGTIIWGEPGTNSQHAFFQLIHQGTKLIPCDFIGFMESLYEENEHQDKLISNYLAQTEALLNGKTAEQVDAEFAAAGISGDFATFLRPFKVFEGNKPTNSIFITKLTPANLGALIALYEHKIFVQGVIWNIFSYDQWGVELGKQLANTLLKDIEAGLAADHDASTNLLLNAYLAHKNS
ncbi:MAG: glucose-6-phosphate isomerase [Flavobacterium sp. BFFFF2]|nr:MAG: glucose-6-phosphate isomerase [Flavobacterium sp. BFFFF2]